MWFVHLLPLVIYLHLFTTMIYNIYIYIYVASMAVTTNGPSTYMMKHHTSSRYLMKTRENRPIFYKMASTNPWVLHIQGSLSSYDVEPIWTPRVMHNIRPWDLCANRFIGKLWGTCEICSPSVVVCLHLSLV